MLRLLSNIQYLILLTTLMLIMGCNSADLPDLGDVTGVVTYNGQPLPGATVAFWPKAGGRTSQGVTNENGEFELRYTISENGAKIGECQVRVFFEPSDENPDEKFPEIPPSFNNQTDLVCNVQAGANTFDIEITY